VAKDKPFARSQDTTLLKFYALFCQFCSIWAQGLEKNFGGEGRTWLSFTLVFFSFYQGFSIRVESSSFSIPGYCPLRGCGCWWIGPSFFYQRLRTQRRLAGAFVKGLSSILFPVGDCMDRATSAPPTINVGDSYREENWRVLLLQEKGKNHRAGNA